MNFNFNKYVNVFLYNVFLFTYLKVHLISGLGEPLALHSKVAFIPSFSCTSSKPNSEMKGGTETMKDTLLSAVT